MFPGILTTPWQTEVFSGELRGVFMLDFTLWDPGMEVAWHCTRSVRTYPAELATVEVSSSLLTSPLVFPLCKHYFDESSDIVSCLVCSMVHPGWMANGYTQACRMRNKE